MFAGVLYGGKWHNHPIKVGALPDYVASAPFGEDSILVAFAAGDVTAKSHNGSHLFVVRGGLSDSIWALPRRVQWSGIGNVAWPAVVVAIPRSDARPPSIMLLGALLHRQSLGADTLFAITSQDGGTSWSPPSYLALAPHLKDVRTAAGPNGSLVVVGTSISTSRDSSNLLHALTFDGKEWSKQVGLPFGRVASTPTLTAVSSDTLLLAWGQLDQTSQVPTTRVAHLAATCAVR